MRTFALVAGIALSLFEAAAAAQQGAPLKLATFNVGWLWDKSTHDKWVETCSTVGWDASKATPEQAKALEGLPYCNVHNGLKYPPHVKCPTLTPAEINQRPLINDKGCRESKDLVDWAAYEERRQSLRAMLSRLTNEGITLVAFQEVFSTQAVREILPPGWEARTSADDSAAPGIPQHVGVAWKVDTHQPSDWGLENTLSSIGTRPLRPGLTFTERWQGKPVKFLVVHLKAGCPSPGTPISEPKTPGEKEACPALEQQVHVLEKWVDGRVGQDFVLIGDFNRRLTFEKKRAPNMGSRPTPKVNQLFPELNDNDPVGSELWIAQPQKVKDSNGNERLVEPCPNGHPSIDHIIISNSLAERVRLSLLQAHAITVDGTTAFSPGAPFRAPPSDHCPHFAELQPK